MNSFNLKNIVLGSASVISGITSKIIKFVKVNKQSDSINELLFYGDGKEETKKQVGLNNLFCIYYVLVHASQSIYVCMPRLNSDTLSKCLINVYQKKQIKIRIIVHNNIDTKNLQTLSKSGLDVKVRNSGLCLEHEFILIDAEETCDDAVALIGSLDFEVNRVNCNKDSTMLTSESVVIVTLRKEFDRIWNSENTRNFTEINEHFESTQE